MRSKTGPLDLLAVFLCAGAFSAGGWFFWTDMTKAIKPSGSERIGTITYKERNAQRKYADRAIWEALPLNSPLYSMDSVRTSQDSQAVLKLDNGAEISLEENTLILLDYSGEKRNIEFLYGNIHTASEEAPQAASAEGARAGAAKAAGITISSKGSKVAIGKGKANIAVSESGKLDLTVTQGSAELSSGGGKQKIGENQQASVMPGSKGAEVKRVSIQITAPAANARLVTYDEASPVDFSWSGDDTGGGYVLEASANADFSSPVSAEADGKQARLSLAPGAYYARVRPVGAEGPSRSSPSVRFKLIKDKPLQAAAPESGASFSYRISPPAIRFAWTGSDIASGYLLEISKSRDFSPPLESIRTETTQAFSGGQSEGEYWWRVRPEYTSGFSGEGRATEAKSYTVGRVPDLAAAQAILPLDNQAIFEKSFRETGLRFSWKPGPETASSILAIFRKGNLADPVLRLNTRDSFLTVDSGLEPGEYVWQVFAQASDGASAPPSQPRAFMISAKAPSLSLKAPADGAELDLSPEPRRFSWESDGDPPFLLELSKDEGFANPAKREASSFAAELAVKDPGTYYWRVSAIDSSGGVISRSPASRLTLLEPLAPPALTLPKADSAIELVNASKLDFSWTAVPRAESYKLRLLDSGGAPVLEKAGLGAPAFALADLSRLSAGAYRVALSAQANSKDGARTSPESFASFSIARIVRSSPPELVEPADGASFDELAVKRSGLDFAWKVGAGLGKAKFSLAKDPGFRQIISEESPPEARTKVRRLDPGTYYWMVSAVAEDGKTFAPAARRFEVRKAPPLGSPAVSSPRQGEKIDMSPRDSLSFQWKAVAEANQYSVKLVSKKSGATIASANAVRGNRWDFSDLSKLDIGQFSFSVQAVSLDESGKEERRSAAATVDFSITLSEGSAKPEILSPNTFYLP